MVDALEIGYSIKERRLELGMTQVQLAEAAGVSKRCLWSMELGRNTGVQLDKLTSVLGVLGLELEIKNAAKLSANEISGHRDLPVTVRAASGWPGVPDAVSILTEGLQ